MDFLPKNKGVKVLLLGWILGTLAGLFGATDWIKVSIVGLFTIAGIIIVFTEKTETKNDKF